MMEVSLPVSSWMDSTGKAVSIALIAPIFSFTFILYLVIKVLKKPTGTGKQLEISNMIKDGAMAFMWRQYTFVAAFCVFVSVLILLFLKTPIDPFAGHQGGTTNKPYFVMMIHFLVGSALSALSGVFGMNVAVRANVRTCEACTDSRNGLNNGLRVAFDSGTVMGLSVVSFVVAGQAFLYLIFEDVLALSGFGFGASTVALFCRVGGGIFTKAADVGADLVGKIESDIPEDDPRNPATIADNVGDNVGDVAGLGADLFESYVGATVASVPLGYHMHGIPGIALPFWISGAGIICSIFGTFFVSTKQGASDSELLTALRRGVISAAILIVISSLVICWVIFDLDFSLAMKLYFCNLIGLFSGIIVGWFTEYMTSGAYEPTRSIVEASNTGSATVIIQGFGVGMLSCIVPGAVLSFAALGCASLQGAYGVSIAAIGMLSTLGITLATDAYGPVADNAGGIAEMSGLPAEVRERTDALDALGNTTAATGKGFAIGSALLITLALISAFVAETVDDKGERIALDMTDKLALSGALIGALLPFLFAALTMFAVGRSAQAIIHEVRRQFRTIDGLLEGKPGVMADNKRCVDICTRAALREMILPGLIACISPVAFGFTFGSKFVGGILVGSILSGFFLGTTMANAGGAWDNAKKSVEAGALGKGKGKGTEWHKATIVGDTVGDPFKDTSGPALNILSKLMSHLSLIVSGSLSYEMARWPVGVAIWVVILLAIAIAYSIRYVCFNDTKKADHGERLKLISSGEFKADRKIKNDREKRPILQEEESDDELSDGNTGGAVHVHLDRKDDNDD